MKSFFNLICSSCLIIACNAQPVAYDLCISNARVFDVATGKVIPHQTILIKNGLIVLVSGHSGPVTATRTINASNKLVTPGFIDTHIHPPLVWGDFRTMPTYLPEDSLDFYRKKLSDTYLPYGVTTVMIMGQPESWLPPILDWSSHPAPQYTDTYTVGGAIVSKENRPPFIGHVVVESPEAAKQKIIEYYGAGIRHIKLYWRLRRPEFEAAFATANSLHMRIYGHIDQNVMRMDTTLKIGLRNYEHIITLENCVVRDSTDWVNLQRDIGNAYGGKPISFLTRSLEYFRWALEHRKAKLDSLTDLMARSGVSFSTTFQLFADPIGLSYYSDNRDTTLTGEDAERAQQNFRMLVAYARSMYERGISIRIGTDCAHGGKAMQSEQVLMAQNSFTTAEILQISTINGARALGLENKYGSVEKGKRANLVIFENDPFVSYRYFTGPKTVIKDGVVYDTN
jgi:imidazolonepropionase-like amidohydrolase